MQRTRAVLSIGVMALAIGLAAPSLAAASGSIAGHVVDGDNNPLVDICVNATDTFGVPAGTAAVTGANGAYEITSLAAGSYKVVFHDDSDTCSVGTDFYITQWYDDKSEFGFADPVTVTDGNTTSGIDATMKEPEAIAGHVKDVNGAPIANICVVVQKADGSSWIGQPPFAQTDADGDYFIELPAGQYKVSFYDAGIPCNAGNYVAQWYNGKPDFASADTVVVATARATFGVDAVMRKLGRITGHVQDEVGAAVVGICVVGADANNPNAPGPPPGFARSNAAGDYVMVVPPGDYKVHFYDNGFPCSIPNFAEQWFNGKVDFASADVVHVSDGATVAAVNATLKPVQVAVPPPPPPPAAAAVKCRVPKLRGMKLTKAKQRLRAAHCRVGRISRRRSKHRLVGKVLASNPRAHAVKPDGTRVALVVGRRAPAG